VLKATAVSHAIQGLVKYHGLRDSVNRIPFHDSISVCVKELYTKTTVEITGNDDRNYVVINNRAVTGREEERVEYVLNKLREVAEVECGFRIVSTNSLQHGKGLGFSASGFSALGVASSKALGLELDPTSLCEIVRLGAGSATRSLAGGFAIWYANRFGRSYAEMIASPEDVDLKMVVVPLSYEVKTEEIHEEVLTSPFLDARLRTVGKTLRLTKNAIENRDISAIGKLAEQDTLSLHATTMTSRNGPILMRPETLLVIDEIRKLRKLGLEAWFSMDTGPSVFINTYPENAKQISGHLKDELGLKTITSGVGGPPRISESHLF